MRLLIMADELVLRYRRALYVVVVLMPALGALYFVPGDDGLRHVGLAFGADRAWGDVYPWSEFARFRDYDPWWGYDIALAALGNALGALVPDRLVRQFVAVKLLSALFLYALAWLAVRRARLAEAISDGYSFALAILLFALVLTDSIARFATIRPFAFGTLLLLYSVGQRGVVRGFVAAALATALYPYLAWIYVGPVVLAHLVRGSRSFALGAAVAGLAGAAFRTSDLLGLVAALGRSAGIRAELGSTLRITELAPTSGSLGLVGLVVLGLFVLLPTLPPERRQVRTEHVMLLCFVPVSLFHVRYLVDVVLPLLFVAHGSDALRAAHGAFARMCNTWRTWLAPFAPLARTTPSPERPAALRVSLALAYTLLLGALVGRSLGQQEKLAAMSALLDPVPAGSLVLTRFNLQYRLLYARPDLSLVPSSEIGFPRAEIAREYVDYLRDGRVCAFAREIGAGFFVEPRAGYVDPRDNTCLSLVADGPKLRIWRIDADEGGM